MWDKFVTDYLSFSRRDRIAIIVIITLIGIVIILPKTVQVNSKIQSNKGKDTAWIAAMKSLEIKQNENANINNYDYENDNTYQYDRRTGHINPGTSEELFYFDPNTLSTEGWRKLGLRDKTIQTIQNYLAKGGKFNKPEDLKKIYGLFTDEFERLAPYIRIAETGVSYQNMDDLTINKPSATNKSKYNVIDVNAADTTAFISLPGIGSKLAARIVNFREKLGGFYSIEQVAETFGLPDSTFDRIKQYLKLEKISVKKININTASLEELKSHPYIKYSIANPVVAYRNQHGPFQKIEELKKVMVITEEVYTKILPYLSLN
jgi:competence ComEA-like helix-hairpin-helix protein